MKKLVIFQSAFTLIELLIAVSIIGILSAVAVPNFLNARIRANVARAYADSQALSSALEMYRLDHNSYIIDYGEPFEEDRTWPQLTTPVSYLNGNIRDPFTRMFYDYGGGAWYEDADSAELGKIREKFFDQTGAGFIILSFAPNRIREFPWDDHGAIESVGKRTPYGLTFVYNASNGLNSTGDIISTRNGSI